MLLSGLLASEKPPPPNLLFELRELDSLPLDLANEMAMPSMNPSPLLVEYPSSISIPWSVK